MEPSTWREMRSDELRDVARVAAIVHPLYPEKDEIFAERLRLHASGSRVLTDGAGAIIGYVVSHPWRFGAAPALDSLLGAIPADSDCYYIHDIALLPVARGQGAAQSCVAGLADHARRSGFTRMALIAIAGTQDFWEKQGFAAVDDPALAAKLASYDPSARYMSRAL